MLFVQLFEMQILSRDCWLTLTFGFQNLRPENDGLSSQYNPKSLQDSQQLICPSLAQQTFLNKNF